ncbi:MAG: SurA N-terminal domain-containing protein [Alphaproteobacteria bacterium]|nr:SurA N-terminal domain-containing protein [Alphaproteobacteria bacterium]
MLEALRNATKSWVMKIFLGALALTFVLFFGTDFGGGGGGGSTNSALEVGDESFTVQQVTRQFNEEVRQEIVRTGQRLDTQTAVNRGVLDRTIARMASQSLFDQAAQKFGVAVSVNEASKAIRNLPQFQDTAGRFSRAQFEANLQNRSLTEADFVNQVRLDLLRNQYIGTIQNSIAAPAALGDIIHGRIAERRIADIVTLPAGASSMVPNPDSVQLDGFYRENSENFETAEFRSATISSLDTETLAKIIVISSEDIAEEYENRINDFDIPETRNVLQASLLSREDAERALDLIRGGKSLNEATREVSGLPLVDMGTVSRAGIALPEIADATFSLSLNQVSAPVESILGWHLIEVTKILPGRTILLSEAQDGIRNELANEEAIDRIFDILNDVEDGLAGGRSIDEVARDSSMLTIKVEAIANNGRTATSEPDAAPALPPQLLARLFEMDNTGATEVIESQTGGFSVVRLDRIDAPRIPELDEVRDRVVDEWKSDRSRDLADEKARKITERTKSGESLKELAGEFGGRFERTPAFDRTGGGTILTPDLIDALFEAKAGEVVSVAIASGSAVGKLVNIEAADPNDPLRKQIARTITGQIANDLVTQLSDALQNEIPIDIDREALEAAFIKR